MGSQLVDHDGDGRLDFFTATYDGSPHIAYGIDGGFAEPQHLLDRDGQRIRLAMFWDDAAKQWTNVGAAHCISAVLFDWDGDGDHDLLMGDKNRGALFLQRNEGSREAAAFTGTSEEILAGGEPFGLHGGMTAPRLVDWDGDGLMDIVAGSFGDPYTATPPGGVYLYRNVGAPGAPRFDAAATLIPPTAITADEADRPNVGLYADPVDYDGDGDLDLLVGGYSIVPAKTRILTAEEQARLTELKASLPLASQATSAILAKVYEREFADERARREAIQAAVQSEDYKAASARMLEVRMRILELEPQPQRVPGIWIYLRT